MLLLFEMDFKNVNPQRNPGGITLNRKEVRNKLGEE